MTNEFVGRRFLSCFGRHCTLGHVLAHVTNRENGAVSNSRPPLLELIAVEPSSLEEGDFRFSHPDCVLDTSTIGLLISFQCNDVFQHLESPAAHCMRQSMRWFLPLGDVSQQAGHFVWRSNTFQDLCTRKQARGCGAASGYLSRSQL